METSVMEYIRKRRSVRTFRDCPLSESDRAAIEAYLASVNEALGVPIEFRLLNAEEYGLSSPVIVGARLYVGVKVQNAANAGAAAGFAFENFVLCAEALGLGTVILAGTLDRPAFERAMEVGEGESMPVAAPIGYPAERMSVRETLMRKGVKADARLPFETLFFENDFHTPLSPERAGAMREALEAVRLAPSAVNRQPWRIVLDEGTAHFYRKGSKGMEAVQAVDLGIALAHFTAVLNERGIGTAFAVCDPGIASDADTTYAFSCRMEQA